MKCSIIIFLSNLVTVIINMFVKTGKNIVRMIREGFFSIVRAIKLMCCPPAGMSFKQAAHEASKIIASGIVIIGGVALEEYVDKMIKLVPLLEFISDILTSVVIGTVTAICTTLVVYMIDKIDFFGVNHDERHAFVMKQLEASMDASVRNAEKIAESIVF